MSVSTTTTKTKTTTTIPTRIVRIRMHNWITLTTHFLFASLSLCVSTAAAHVCTCRSTMLHLYMTTFVLLMTDRYNSMHHSPTVMPTIAEALRFVSWMRPFGSLSIGSPRVECYFSVVVVECCCCWFGSKLPSGSGRREPMPFPTEHCLFGRIQ